MPHATEILDGLSAIANQASGIAVAWHIVIAMALVALAAGWHPSQRTARLLMGMPLASVAGGIWKTSNFESPYPTWTPITDKVKGDRPRIERLVATP